ncbi:alpha/beta hydrolase [Nocardia sp. NBC_01730]|uniref:alpha/beta fold hydrolase n=1 Tax=Nocardia sp. NBC_01730 TaxID=2975998 RepID=UPI002E14F3A2|nr:alpha/beta hydrolase [Nocardia sp. NBC_01730]
MFSYPGRDGQTLFAAEVGTGARTVVLLHGGGPDHRSLLPLGHRLAGDYRILLPDIRGYGRSLCPDPACHTWPQYAEDAVALLDHLGIARSAIGGTGMGSTIAARTLLAYPDRFDAGILISVEEIEDDEAKQAETAMMDAFAVTVATDGIEAAWAPILPALAPVIETLVREAIPRSDPASIAAAAAIGRDRSFRNSSELAAIAAPTLVFPGIDERHPTSVAQDLVRILPNGHLAPNTFTADIRTADDLADTLAPGIRAFLTSVFND